MSVQISLPDGRFLSGCCHVATGDVTAEAPPDAGPAPRPAPTPAPARGDWISSVTTFLPAIAACLAESRRAEAVLFAAVRPDHTVHLVLRLPEARYADCVLPPGRGPIKVTIRPRSATLSPPEGAALLTLLPHEPPIGGCFRSQVVFDDQGRRLGWATFKEC
jgi:hypothetical protein